MRGINPFVHYDFSAQNFAFLLYLTLHINHSFRIAVVKYNSYNEREECELSCEASVLLKKKLRSCLVKVLLLDVEYSASGYYAVFAGNDFCIENIRLKLDKRSFVYERDICLRNRYSINCLLYADC